MHAAVDIADAPSVVRFPKGNVGDPILAVRTAGSVDVLAEPARAYPNGDQVQFTSLTFRCSVVAGEARVNDEESIDVGWFDVDDLPPMRDDFVERILLALPKHGDPRFVR